MMWHQLQLAAAVRLSMARDHAKAGRSSAVAPSPSATFVAPSSSTTSAKRSSSSPEDEWLKLGDWPFPALPQPAVPDDGQQTGDFRDATQQAVQRCLQNDLAPNTVKTYESLIKHDVALAAANLSMELLPMVRENQFTAFFGSLLVSHADSLKWSRVRSLKAALAQWHKRRQQICVFDTWTPSMAAFWHGLAKQCSHESQGKDPIALEAVTEYLEVNAGSENPAVVRNMAMVAVAFFGLRRSAEVLALKIEDVQHIDENGVSLKVRCQKNDQCGLGQICFIPCITGLRSASPDIIVKQWLELRGSFINQISDKYLFVTTTGSKKGSQVSYDSFRKHVQEAFGSALSTHSLRKGGAVFYARSGAVEDATRQQGGWRTTTVMKNIYTTLSKSEVQRELLRVVNGTSDALRVRSLFKSLGKSADEVLRNQSHTIQPFLDAVHAHSAAFSKEFLLQSKVVAALHVLTRHTDMSIQAQASRLYTIARSSWMASGAKRVKAQ